MSTRPEPIPSDRKAKQAGAVDRRTSVPFGESESDSRPRLAFTELWPKPGIHAPAIIDGRVEYDFGEMSELGAMPLPPKVGCEIDIVSPSGKATTISYEIPTENLTWLDTFGLIVRMILGYFASRFFPTNKPVDDVRFQDGLLRALIEVASNHSVFGLPQPRMPIPAGALFLRLIDWFDEDLARVQTGLDACFSKRDFELRRQADRIGRRLWYIVADPLSRESFWTGLGGVAAKRQGMEEGDIKAAALLSNPGPKLYVDRGGFLRIDKRGVRRGIRRNAIWDGMVTIMPGRSCGERAQGAIDEAALGLVPGDFLDAIEQRDECDRIRRLIDEHAAQAGEGGAAARQVLLDDLDIESAVKSYGVAPRTVHRWVRTLREVIQARSRAG